MENSIPNHIAIIPDGNRRWAKENNLPSLAGHKKGLERGLELARHARRLGVHTLTAWGFSCENWSRAKEESSYLMKIFESFLDSHLDEALRDEVRFYHLGKIDNLPKSLAEKIEQVVEKTSKFTKHVMNLCIDYSGQDELLRAFEKAHIALSSGNIALPDLFKEVGKYAGKYPILAFKDFLDTKDQPYPYPDLIIRTSGEQRLSGFMPWQSAYSEYYFAKEYFPDFTNEKLEEAINSFTARNRRFGGSST